VETNTVNIMKLRKCTREEFVAAITEDKADGFAKTFRAKADMQEHWDDCLGVFNEQEELMGAIITTVGKTNPKVANLQLLHTFNKHRRKGVAKHLTLVSYEMSKVAGAIYFRVSAEPDAVKFYESIGFKFWGLQKSGCSLSVFKINGTLQEGIYNDKDPVLQKALYSGRKGSLASSYTEKKSVDLNSFL
jgi:ribosomal protein S18 acetylase RimI-like enzyme